MNCDIIKDLLPLYCDGVCSEETSRAVEEHLTTCPACRTLLDEMRREPVMPEPIQTQAKQEAKVSSVNFPFAAGFLYWRWL